MTQVRDKLIDALQSEAQQASISLAEFFDPSDGATSDDASGASDVSPLAAAAQAGLLPEAVLRAVALVAGAAYVDDLSQRPASALFVERVPIHYARKHGLLGLAATNGSMPIVLSDAAQLDELEVLSRYLRTPVTPVLCLPGVIRGAINAAYQQRSGQADALIEKLDAGEMTAELEQLKGREDLLDVATRSPVIKLVNLMLFDAVQQLASDVHIQPYEEKLVVRMRIDGVLFDVFDLPKAMQEEIVSRVKVMARMNIAEKRLPQDGRATVQVGDRTIDLRIASLPGAHGERLVIRLLDKSARLYSLEELGMASETLSHFRGLIGIEHGLVLVTGPTGSGKTTTLYAALQQINTTQRNIITLEDPIEYQLPGVSQTQVNARKGLTFASGLRSVLRQDPDIIMVGEIRDHETAVMAIQSALTGHLVFSTLHTNDAASAVTRLLDLGIEPYLAASSVIGVLAQRLVRRVCGSCGQSHEPTDEQLKRLSLDRAQLGNDGTFVRGDGCEHCRNTGYSGRVGIFELLAVDETIREKIQGRATASQIKSAAVADGMRTLRDDGVGKVLARVTTVDEVQRVTMRATV